MSVVETLTSWTQPDRVVGAPQGRGKDQRHLRPVESAPATAARVPFVAVLGAVLVAGLLGLLVLNTAIQSQAKQLNSLQNEATALGYQQGELTTQVQQLRSASTLEQKAYALGLRPNPHPAFITLANGTIVGTPTPVTGKELPDQKWSSWQQQQTSQEAARAQVAAEAKRKADEARRKAEELKKKQAQEKKLADEKKKAEELKKAGSASAKPSTSTAPTATTGNR
ncbi:hypothetical protein ACSDQ9_11065 [Aestuariimicrobium soli]|uniref:hypothetical protein n=1 Tax=Aestuariimicrobium soli TaxID=2035834 RepID=UPI003EBC1510